MPLTNLQFPGGYFGPGVANLPVAQNPIGAVLYVNSTIGSDSAARVQRFGNAPAGTTAGTVSQGPWVDPSRPLASIFGTNGALSFCSASRGDLIIVQAGHLEPALNAASPAIPAGVSIVGLGYGGGRPLITLNNAAATITCSGFGVQMQNLVFSLAFAAVTVGFTVTAPGVQIVNCRIVQSGNVVQGLTAISLGAGADDFMLANTEIDATLAAGATQAILVASAVNRTVIRDCFIHGDFSAACLVGTNSNKLQECQIFSNRWIQKNGTAKVVWSLGNADSGIFANNVLQAGAGVGGHSGLITGGSSASLLWANNQAYFAKAGGPFSTILIPDAGTIP